MKKSSWNDTLTGSSWRLDVLAKTQHIDEVFALLPPYNELLSHSCCLVQLSEPSAIMELKVDQAGGLGTDVVRFEMSAAQVAEMVGEVDKIEAQIKSLTA